MRKIIVFSIVLLALFFFLGRELNPFDSLTFLIHDNTQAARIQEFALNLKNGIIPPRIAPNFSFAHGFPVFNFYAPFAYWLGSSFHLLGFSSVLSLKIILLLGLIGSFIAFFLFASLFFGFLGGILGASIYSSSLWMAVEIFVRGNVGEIWFMALLPLSLYTLKRSDTENKPWLFLFSCITLSFLFTVHNVLSLVSVLFIFFFSLLLVHRKKALLSMVVALLLSSYFLIPALLEVNLTYAGEIAARTKYSDHFLCVWQVWRADKWSFGGSGIGCINDDMSFQIGKIHLLLAGIGVGIFIFQLMKNKKRKETLLSFFILIWTFFSAFLTISISKPLWDRLSFVMSSFQFPWRFLPFVVFGTAYFASRIVLAIKNKGVKSIIVVILSLCILYSSSKFFSRPWKYSLNEYSEQYVSKTYIETRAAYEISEYFPRSGDYKTWRMYDSSKMGFYTNTLLYKTNTPFYKEIFVDQNQITLPIHYFPFWKININGANSIPRHFDKLGRPIFSRLPLHSTVVVRYNETLIEKTSNIVTVITFIMLITVITNEKLWKRMNTILQ